MSASSSLKKVEKSSSQNSGGGSVSSAAGAARDKRKHGKDKKSVESPSISPAPSNVGVIKSSGTLKREGTDGASGTRRSAPGGAEKEKTEKGILKNKKSRSKSGDTKKPVVKSKGKVKANKRSFFEKIALGLGFYVGDVTLTDPYAIEAAQALDLQQWHLRRLKLRFDKIDLDGSGNIDYDEFFESIGEMRSPFTDKLFALIGKFRSSSPSKCFFTPIPT